MNIEVSQAEKSNFHMHLTGSLSPRVVRQLSSSAGLTAYPFEALEDDVDFEQPDIWAAAKELTSTEAGLIAALDHVVAQERLANVSYLELTLNSFGMIRRGLDSEQLANIVTRASDEAQAQDLCLRYKFGVNRKDGPGSVDTVLESYLACPPQLRVGIDLNGDELQYPTADFVGPFRMLASAGIRTIIHAGEFPGMTASLKDALDADPARIGHAVAAIESRSLMYRLRAQAVTVEVAPSSNLARGAVSAMSEHPLGRLLDWQIPVVMGTDDPGIFANTMTTELGQLQDLPMSTSEILTLNSQMNGHRLIDLPKLM